MRFATQAGVGTALTRDELTVRRRAFFNAIRGGELAREGGAEPVFWFGVNSVIAMVILFLRVAAVRRLAVL
ncbi:MAG: hypothetical protein JWN85_1791 [Gammaproteobacteria bacterium]|nr:hypothetical protein [Gammaproteobacteria bacterium]